MNLQGKRLLVTGGANFADDIFEFTRAKGIVVVTTGTTHNRIMELADEVYSVDTSNYEELLKLAEEKRIDGIFAGGNEPNIITAIRVSEKLNLPYYCNMVQWDALMNKANFKERCRQFGIPVTKEFDVHTIEDAEKCDIEYPVIVKPVDSCGSKGVIFCSDLYELKKAIEEALRFSASKKVIVEQYVTGEEISATYTICNGNITLSCIKEKYPVAEQTGLMNMPNVYIYPSKHLDQYVEEINDHAIEMLKSLNLQFGSLFLQGFVNPSGIYMFEAGYRPGGTNDFRYTDMMNGVNQMHLLIEQALTGGVDDNPNERDNPRFRQYCCSFTMCARGGKIHKIDGLEEIEGISQIKSIEQFYHESDTIPFGKTLAQRMLRYFIIADSLHEVEDVINKIQDNVNVTNEKGESVLYSRFDTKRLY